MLLSELERWTEGITTRLPLAEAKAASAEAKVAAAEAALVILAQRVRALEERPWPMPGPLPDPIPPGPRVKLGADVELLGPDAELAAAGVRPSSRTAAGIQAAIGKAAAGSRVVFLPGGQYTGGIIRVPGGITIIGEGSRTVIQCPGQTFFAEGPDVRLSRLVLRGASQTWIATNPSRAIENYGVTGTRVDCCDISGFSYGLLAMRNASVRVEQCRISRCFGAGSGYGMNFGAGTWARVADCDLSECRHMLASGGNKAGETWRPTHWEMIHCRVGSQSLLQGNQQAALDTHPGMDGAFVVERCVVENVGVGMDVQDGTGLVSGNQIRNVGIGFYFLGGRMQDGKVGLPRDVRFEGNEWQVGPRFQVSGAANIYLNGEIIPETLRTDLPPLPALKRLALKNDGSLEMR
jgi:hypothetical protein